jgi:hypothetical protein
MQSPSIQSQTMQPPASPLDQLADIHLPDGVSWWPLAPGWWILLALLVIAAIGVYLWRRRITQNAYRIVAQHQLAGIYADYQQTQNAAAYLQALSLLLRRTALTAYPHNFNASIKGNEWLAWLDSVCPALGEKFTGDIGQLLLSSAYQKNPQIDVGKLQALSSQWINLHRNYHQTHRMHQIRPKNSKKTKTAAEASHV